MQPNSNLEIPQQIGPILQALCDVAKKVARLIARGGLGQDLRSAMGTNSDGDGQKALDVIADDAFRTALAGTDVRWYASEEQDHVVALNPQGRFGLAIDPLDGSSNIDVNVSIGTIFSIVPALEDQTETFLFHQHRDWGAFINRHVTPCRHDANRVETLFDQRIVLDHPL